MKELVFGKRTYIMGILNITPDSFSDGGDFLSPQEALAQATKMIAQGADILDIGAESTRPGARAISAQEEMRRLEPVLRPLAKLDQALLSIDTYKAEVADFALSRGVRILNDIWGFQKDSAMARVAAKSDCLCVLMHNQEGHHYERDIMDSLLDFFEESLRIADQAGIGRERLIVDPGIGFGKNAKQNLEVLRRLHELKSLGLPILLGASRKSTLGKILDLPPKERVEATLVTTALGIWQGVDIVRVHDVQENCRAARVADAVIGRGEFLERQD